MNTSMLRLLNELTAIESRGPLGYWQPAADVYRTARGWLVKFDLAGVPPSDLEVQRHHRRLTIRGTRRDALVQQGLCSYSLEINYNRFERSVELPVDIEAYDLNTEYQDGMFLVWCNR